MGAGHSSRNGAHCDTELVIHSAKELEWLLESTFGATGKGLHEKITSVESSLPPALVKRLRFLATIRNRLIHERGFTAIPDRAGFIEAFDAAAAELRAIVAQRHGPNAAATGKGCVIT